MTQVTVGHKYADRAWCYVPPRSGDGAIFLIARDIFNPLRAASQNLCNCVYADVTPRGRSDNNIVSAGERCGVVATYQYGAIKGIVGGQPFDETE
ncbi:MAG: hypothetical protein LKJ57_05165 [Ancrocorticia sp.]|nr:hypothetical protein [Ancrocorticia sp.]MCI1964047.1 hypothetical protein [Ancrocorticia sp.]MCI2001731.1 hypothetical protein [Ancrocorticia sp.]MCI2012973.1 hypothetical protein [Ancrocorticia sp.]MCI2029750.1 hypothetical protein [Ancrocorticia sp.]